MTIAAIGDIHGNIHALNAVMDDAKRFGVETYIFLGDYCIGWAFPNEVVSFLKKLPSAFFCRGNQEELLLQLRTEDQQKWRKGQFSATYWTYSQMDDDNLLFVTQLPETIAIEVNGIKILAAHKQESFTKTQKSSIYLSGHTHIQNKTMIGGSHYISCGSCGIPLSNSCGAEYAIIRIINYDEQKIVVELRHITYNVDNAIKAGFVSTLCKTAPIWCELISREIGTAQPHFIPFIEFADRYSIDLGIFERPFNEETWNNAYYTWLRSKQ